MLAIVSFWCLQSGSPTGRYEGSSLVLSQIGQQAGDGDRWRAQDNSLSCTVAARRGVRAKVCRMRCALEKENVRREAEKGTKESR